jgi:hypothetical protein
MEYEVYKTLKKDRQDNGSYCIKAVVRFEYHKLGGFTQIIDIFAKDLYEALTIKEGYIGYI